MSEIETSINNNQLTIPIPMPVPIPIPIQPNTKQCLNTISYNEDSNNPNINQSQISIPQNVIGDFIIGAKLGEGTFSKVCQGTHRITKEKVAIKILSKDLIKEPHDKVRIEKEINVQKKLHHINIIQQYCIIESKTAIYIITEYCSNGELFDFIVSKRKLIEQEACRIFQQLIAGLEYLHKQKIVHRDLKPENLLFNSKNELKIADFGLSNEYIGKLKTPCGSPCYAAPEMVTGRKYDGDAVDIWSAGVVLYTMVCGYLPFEDKNQSALFGKISKGIYTLPSFLSGSCKDMLKCLLVVDPVKRYSFEQIKHHPWFQAINCVSNRNIFFMSPGLCIKTDIVPFDEDIVRALVIEYKYELKDVICDVTMNKHNSITTSYYLLVRKKVRNGEKSISDFSSNSELFMEYIKKSISKLAYFANNFDFIIDYYYNRMKRLVNNDRNGDSNGKGSIDLGEDHCQQVIESTMPTENGGIVVSQSQVINKDKDNEVTNVNRQSLTNRGAVNKKYAFPMTQFNKFINKQQSLDESASSALTSNKNNNKESQELEDENSNSNGVYISTEPNGNENKAKYNTINCNYNDKKNYIYKKNQSRKSGNGIIANKIELNASLNSKTIKANSNGNCNGNSYKPLKDSIVLKQKVIIKTNTTNCPVIKEEPQKTTRLRFLNTSMISESRSNSPMLPIEGLSAILKQKSIKSQYAESKDKPNKDNDKEKTIGLPSNKQTHYSQEHTNAIDIEIACGRNKGNSFNATDLNTVKSIPISNRDSARIKNSSIKKKHPASLIYGLPIKKIQYKDSIKDKEKDKDKEGSFRTNLNKFVNIAPSKTKKTKNPLPLQLNLHLKNKSLEVAKTTRTNNYSFPKSHRKLISLSIENDKKKVINKSFLNIYCKKTLNEIKESVISVVGKDVTFLNEKNVDKLQLECKYNTKQYNISFLLNIKKIPDIKDYYLITPTLIKGNMWSVKCVFDKIKAKLIAF